MERKIGEIFKYQDRKKIIILQVVELIKTNADGELLLCDGCFFEKNCEKRNKDQLGKCFDREDQKNIIFKNPKR